MILVVFFIEIILIQQLGIPKYFGREKIPKQELNSSLRIGELSTI